MTTHAQLILLKLYSTNQPFLTNNCISTFHHHSLIQLSSKHKKVVN